MFRRVGVLTFQRFQRQLLVLRRFSSPSANQTSASDGMESCGETSGQILLLGMYSEEEDRFAPGTFTHTALRYNERTNGVLLTYMNRAAPAPQLGEMRLLFGAGGEKSSYSAIGVVGLGRQCLGYNPYEVLDEQKESIRRAVGRACMECLKYEVKRLDIESMGHAESAAEGAALGIWAYQELRQQKYRIKMPHIDLFALPDEPCDIEGWRIGIKKAAAQNLARYLQEMPSNLLTPTSFAQFVIDMLCKSGVNVELKVEGWARNQGMNAFLAVSKASCEPPIFMELSYYGAKPDSRPIVMVGQGITYDCGGLCLRSPFELRDKRGDMTGAAVVVAACRAIAALQLPVRTFYSILYYSLNVF